MGFHLCEWCYPATVVVPDIDKEKNKFDNASSGDVTLVFDNGHQWVMPDMILHYVADHGWQPPHAFVEDVMVQTMLEGRRRQTRSSVEPTPVGYLRGGLIEGPVPDNFIEKLEALTLEADKNGYRSQTKSLGINNLRSE